MSAPSQSPFRRRRRARRATAPAQVRAFQAPRTPFLSKPSKLLVSIHEYISQATHQLCLWPLYTSTPSFAARFRRRGYHSYAALW